MILQDHLPDGDLLILIDRIGYKIDPIRMIDGITLGQLLLYLLDIGIADLLVVSEDSFFHAVCGDCLKHILPHLLRDRIMLIIMLLLAALSNDGVDKLDDLLVHIVCGENSIQHDIIRDHIGSGFDHDDLVTG